MRSFQSITGLQKFEARFCEEDVRKRGKKMDLGSEISHKFKASVKRKLKECGTYIDDELPEYIMVMIANKRKNHQMKEDLSLFLGEETDIFVEWLFQMLGKLQNAAQDFDTENGHSEAPEKAQSIVKDSENGPENDIDKNPESTEPKEETEKKDEDLMQRSNKVKDPDGMRLSLNKKSKFDTDDVGDSSNVKVGTKIPQKAEPKNSPEEKRPSKLKRRRSDRGSSPQKTIDSSSEIREENKKDSSKRRKSSFSTSFEASQHSLDEDDTAESSAAIIPSTVAVQKIRPSFSWSPQAPGLLVRKAISEANESVTGQLRKKATSHHQTLDIQKSNAVERRVQLKRGRIKMTDSTPQFANGKDPEEFELEPEESMANNGKMRRPGEADKNQEDGIELEVGENEFLDEDRELKKKGTKRIVIANRGSDYENGGNGEERGAKRGNREYEKENLDRIENGDFDERDLVEKEEQNRDRKDDELRKDKRKKRHKRDRSSSHRDRRHNSPKFVVTLHGALDDHIKKQKKRRDKKTNDIYNDQVFINLHPKEPMKILESAQKEIDKMAHHLDMMQNILPKTNLDPYNSLLPASITIPKLSGITASMTRPIYPEALPLLTRQANDGVLTSTLYSQSQNIAEAIPLQSPVFLLQNTSPNGATKINRKPSREVVVPLQSDDDEDMSEDEKGAKNLTAANCDQSGTILERCKFWPNCKNSSCTYVHPSKSCRMFPNCNFKEKCIFIHPMCKFDGRCSNLTCPYSHSIKQSVFPPFAAKGYQREISVDSKVPICKFVPNCSRSNCHFRHPISKPCRYGSGCKRIDCQFHHETRPAKGEDLKWSSASLLPSKHVSERIFAAPEMEVKETPVAISTR